VKQLATTKLSLPKVNAALRKTTEALASEVTSPTNEPPQWSEFEWRIAKAVASMQGIASLLWGTIRWQSPARWRQFLEQQRDHILRRQHRISQLLELIDVTARREGVATMALKGAALHAAGVYQAGERPMADIDLLVRPSDQQAMLRLLEGLDYSITTTDWRHQALMPRIQSPHATLGEHADNPIRIELHTRIMELLPVSAVDITSFVLPREMHAGLNAYPCDVALMMHLLLHAAGSMRSRALRLVQLHDIARLAARFSAADWEQLRTARLDAGLWWVAPPLILTARYYAGVIPHSLLAQVESKCPWLLAKLSRGHGLMALSWSNIRIQAFPGIEWARTPREALRFALSRIWPSRAALHDLEVYSKQNPRTAAIPWYGISHGARIVRWVFSRPPRVQSMLAIRAALEQDWNDPL
jgi:Uncharacterised nucleotidyltransferase